MATVNDQYQELAKPFPPEAIMRKPGGGGKMLDYVTARHIMNRIDAVVGPNRWWDEYEVVPGPIPGVICKLTIEFEPGEPVTKCGFGSFEAMPDNDNAFKSGESNALRRAAVKFGIGRNLYKNGVVVFSDEEPGGEEVYGNQAASRPAQPSNGQYSQPAPVSGGSGQPATNPPPAAGSMPQHGGQLFKWANDIGGKAAVDWVKDWGKPHGLDWQFKNWPAQAAIDAAAAYMAHVGGGSTQPASQPAPQSSGSAATPYGIPTDIEKPADGRGLFKLIKKIEEKYPTLGFLAPVNEYGKLHHLNGRMVDWTPADVQKSWEYLGSIVQKQKQNGNIPAGEYFGLNGQAAPQQSSAPYDGAAKLTEIRGIVADIISLRGEQPDDAAIADELLMILSDCHQGKSSALVLTDPHFGSAVLETVRKDLEGRRQAAGVAY